MCNGIFLLIDILWGNFYVISENVFWNVEENTEYYYNVLNIINIVEKNSSIDSAETAVILLEE